MPKLVRRISVFILAVAIAAPASAGLLDKLKDPETGQIDITDWLLKGGGFLPVPIIVTEPAVGFGLGLAPTFFHDFNHPGTKQKELSVEEFLEYPPSATAGFALYTTNGSWVAGAAHMGNYLQDRIRYTGALAYADVNLKFYVLDNPLNFEMKGLFTIQDVRFKLGKTKWFLGADYGYFNSNVNFKLDEAPESPGDSSSSNAGLGAIAYFDNRNTTFTPDTGREFLTKISRYDTALGGDYKYWQFDLDLKSFHQVAPAWVVGWRVKGSATDGETPFWALPFVFMRGVPAMRYQGDSVAQIETEARWDFKGPWSMVGFLGYGQAWSDVPILDSDDLILAGGAGIRVNIAPKLRFRTGIDIARGPEQWTIYLQFGHAWGF